MLIPHPPIPQTVRKGQLLDYEGLRAEAEALVDASGFTQIELSERLGVAQASLSRALNRSGGKYAALQRRVIALLSPKYEVEEEPLFRVREKEHADVSEG